MYLLTLSVGRLNNENVELDTSLTLGNALSEMRIRHWEVMLAGGIQLAYLLTAGAVPMVVHVIPLLVEYSNFTVATELKSHSMYCPVPVPKLSPPLG